MQVITVVVYAVDVPPSTKDPQARAFALLDAVLPDSPGRRIQFPKQVLALMNDGIADPSLYTRWFDKDSSTSWSDPEKFAEYNWLFLRQQQRWCNDMLKARGHLSLNDVYSILGLSQTSIGALVGWYYGPDTEDEPFVDFGCWGQGETPADPERKDATRLSFNVQGPIWQLLD